MTGVQTCALPIYDMQKFSNMPLSEVASAAVPAARRVAVPTAKPASLSAEALNIPRSGIRDVFDRVERVPDAISLTVGEPSATAAPHIVAAACEAAQAGRTRYTTDIRAQTAELQKIGVNVNQIARRLNSMGPLYTQDVADIKGALAQIWQLQRYILSSQR